MKKFKEENPDEPLDEHRLVVLDIVQWMSIGDGGSGRADGGLRGQSSVDKVGKVQLTNSVDNYGLEVAGRERNRLKNCITSLEAEVVFRITQRRCWLTDVTHTVMSHGAIRISIRKCSKPTRQSAGESGNHSSTLWVALFDLAFFRSTV